jgi:Domain of unknown function (DUF4249)
VKSRITGTLPILAISLWVLFSGCETSLDLPTDNLSKLTILSHLATGSWEKQRVYVYASQSPSDSSQFFTPADLEVDVTEFESEITIRLDSTREGNDIFFDFPQGFLKGGNTYSISASAPGFETVRATTIIPEPSTITNMTIKDVDIKPSDKNEFKKIIRYKVVLDINHVGSNRYYHLVFYNKYKGLNWLPFVDPELSDDQPFLHHYDYGILIDKDDLKNPDQALVFNFVDWIVEDDDLERIYVELRTITEDYYRYHSTLARQVIVRQDPFAEPVTIFNNIEGGYGNFSGFSPDVSSSDLPK